MLFSSKIDSIIPLSSSEQVNWKMVDGTGQCGGEVALEKVTTRLSKYLQFFQSPQAENNAILTFMVLSHLFQKDPILIPELVVASEGDWLNLEEEEYVHVFQLFQPQFWIPTTSLDESELNLFWLMTAMVEASRFDFSKESVRRMNLFLCHLEKLLDLDAQNVGQMMLSLAVLLMVIQLDDERLRSPIFLLFMRECFYPTMAHPDAAHPAVQATVSLLFLKAGLAFLDHANLLGRIFLSENCEPCILPWTLRTMQLAIGHPDEARFSPLIAAVWRRLIFTMFFMDDFEHQNYPGMQRYIRLLGDVMTMTQSDETRSILWDGLGYLHECQPIYTGIWIRTNPTLQKLAMGSTKHRELISSEYMHVVHLVWTLLPRLNRNIVHHLITKFLPLDGYIGDDFSLDMLFESARS